MENPQRLEMSQDLGGREGMGDLSAVWNFVVKKRLPSADVY